MGSFAPKKLALIRIWQILKDYSDYEPPLTQEDIAKHLENEYGIVIERKADQQKSVTAQRGRA